MNQNIGHTSDSYAIFWHRRDLRMNDNTGLHHALLSGLKVIPLFIFDTDILSKIDDRGDARVEFIVKQLDQLRQAYQRYGGDLLLKIGKPVRVLDELQEQFNLKAIYTNTDYEPYARQRDQEVADMLKSKGVGFQSFKDQVIFEKDEILKSDGSPYTVFTPYMKKWKEKLLTTGIRRYPTENLMQAIIHARFDPSPSLADLGFYGLNLKFPDSKLDRRIIFNYEKNRDYPALDGTSRLGIHLRFGTLSIRFLVEEAERLSQLWLNELIWREFFMQILYHFPHTVYKAFKPAFDNIRWLNDEHLFEAWRRGQTGYPMVDAGLRELLSTGFMHNRVRMVVASFLCKHLLTDWRIGEAWFASQLLDFEQASNVGNWQWAAGSGCDAAPYFRVFNPSLQAERFDPQEKYIRKWIPELGTSDYPKPVVDHDFARKRAIEAYKKALSV